VGLIGEIKPHFVYLNLKLIELNIWLQTEIKLSKVLIEVEKIMMLANIRHIDIIKAGDLMILLLCTKNVYRRSTKTSKPFLPFTINII